MVRIFAIEGKSNFERWFVPYRPTTPIRLVIWSAESFAGNADVAGGFEFAVELGFRQKIMCRHSRESGNPDEQFDTCFSGFLPAQEW